MANSLFSGAALHEGSIVLDPGSGRGAFVEGVLRWFSTRGRKSPTIHAVESNPALAGPLRRRYASQPSVQVIHRDFLRMQPREYDFVIGNPPYVPITRLTEHERRSHRKVFTTARGRFDLYTLFFEQGLRFLRPGGRLTFVTPEKFVYVQSAGEFRRFMGQFHVEEIQFLDEGTFGPLVTYPAITTIEKMRGDSLTRVVLRDGTDARVRLPKDGKSWLPAITGYTPAPSGAVLIDLCVRVSCGVATGADDVFVMDAERIAPELRPYTYRTLAGRELTPKVQTPAGKKVMLVPYDRVGQLIPFHDLGALATYLSRPKVRARLEKRACAARKPWYAFHETPPLAELLKPKVVCKDITEEPRFWIDRSGTLVPRHSVYYIVPKPGIDIQLLSEYLNSETARAWLRAHCQRAANGFLRLQSTTLKEMPVPLSVVTPAVAPTLRPKASAGIRCAPLELVQ